MTAVFLYIVFTRKTLDRQKVLRSLSQKMWVYQGVDRKKRATWMSQKRLEKQTGQFIWL